MTRWFSEKAARVASVGASSTALLLSPETPPPIASTERIAAFFVAAYDPFVFSYSMFDFAVMVDRAGQLGYHALLLDPTRMLVPPRSLCFSPEARHRLGHERLKLMKEVLRDLFDEHERSEYSCQHISQASALESPHLLPFLRGVCLSAEVAHPFAPQAAFVFDALLTDGRVSAELFLRGSPRERRSALSQLLFSCSREFGSRYLLLSALSLHVSEGAFDAAHKVARTVNNALAKADRRELDWALKSRGFLKDKLSLRRGWTFGNNVGARWLTRIDGGGTSARDSLFLPAKSYSVRRLRMVSRRHDRLQAMEPHTAATLQLIAKAFALSPTRYNVTVAPHPTTKNTYEVLFSLPTAEAPESPTFVTLTMREDDSSVDGHRSFTGLLEHQNWPLTICIEGDGVLKSFPQRCVDVAWEHKQRVSSSPLWLK